MKKLYGSWLFTIFFLTMGTSTLANSFTFDGYLYSVGIYIVNGKKIVNR